MQARVLRGALGAFALFAVFAADAGAATMSTPLYSASGTDYLVCTATNFGTKTAKIAIAAYDGLGQPLAFDTGTCGETLSARASCYERLDQGVDGACVFTYSGKVKGMVQLFDGVDVVDSLPALK